MSTGEVFLPDSRDSLTIEVDANTGQMTNEQLDAVISGYFPWAYDNPTLPSPNEPRLNHVQVWYPTTTEKTAMTYKIWGHSHLLLTNGLASEKPDSEANDSDWAAIISRQPGKGSYRMFVRMPDDADGHTLRIQEYSVDCDDTELMHADLWRIRRTLFPDADLPVRNVRPLSGMKYTKVREGVVLKTVEQGLQDDIMPRAYQVGAVVAADMLSMAKKVGEQATIRGRLAYLGNCSVELFKHIQRNGEPEKSAQERLTEAYSMGQNQIRTLADVQNQLLALTNEGQPGVEITELMWIDGTDRDGQGLPKVYPSFRITYGDTVVYSYGKDSPDIAVVRPVKNGDRSVLLFRGENTEHGVDGYAMEYIVDAGFYLKNFGNITQIVETLSRLRRQTRPQTAVRSGYGEITSDAASVPAGTQSLIRPVLTDKVACLTRAGALLERMTDEIREMQPSFFKRLVSRFLEAEAEAEVHADAADYFAAFRETRGMAPPRW